jgi:3',5'-cyclic AMP phosphodiesterase CpdA
MDHPRLGRYPAARFVIAHLSDTHFLAGGEPLLGGADTVAHVDRAARQLRRLGDTLAAILVTGDVTDLGEPDAYRRIRDVLEPLAAAAGARLVWIMGNHDERVPFAEILLREASAPPGPLNRVVEIDGLRVIALDTCVPGYHHGALEPETLDWLREVLRIPAPHGTVLAMHHAPIATPLALMDILELRGQDELASVIRGTDVRLILGGHLHYPTQGMFAGIPVSVAGALAYTMDLSAPSRELVGVDGGHSVSLVHLFDDGAVTSVVPVGDHPEVTSFGEQFLLEVEALDDGGRLERFARKRGVPDDG